MLKSGEKGLIGPGSNNYGNKGEWVNNIIENIEKDRKEKEVAKKHVLHHLKQLKAQMGKLKKQEGSKLGGEVAIEWCMQMVDKKLTKINNQ